MEQKLYGQDWLIKNRFPDLKKQIELGDFRVLKSTESDGRTRIIVRFSNLSVFAPDGELIEWITEEFFHTSFENVTFRPYGILGLDFTTK